MTKTKEEMEKEYQESFQKLKNRIRDQITKDVIEATQIMKTNYPKSLMDITGTLATLHMVYHDIVNNSWKTALEGTSKFMDHVFKEGEKK